MASGYIILKKEFIPPQLNEPGEFEIPGALDYYLSVASAKKMVIFPEIESTEGQTTSVVSPSSTIARTVIIGDSPSRYGILISIPTNPSMFIVVESDTPDTVIISEA